MTAITITDLSQVVSESGVEPQTAVSLKTAFLPFFQQLAEWQAKAEAISVTSVNQTGEMKLARTVRLELKKIRTDADKTRAELKKLALATGNAVQSVYNAIRDAVQPLEEYLEKQERFAEIQEAHEKAERKFLRETEIAPFAAFAPAGLRLEDLDEESFARTLTGAKAAMEAKLAADARAEQERVERELAEAAERERVRLENEKLRAEAAVREAEMRKERELAEAALAKERAIRDSIQREAAQRAEEEIARRAAVFLAEAAAKAAPDTEKLAAYAVRIETLMLAAPTVESPAALKSLGNALTLLQGAANSLAPQP